MNVAFLIVFVIIIGIILLLSLATWVLYSLGLYKLAKNKGMDNAWLAWIPIANYYVLGSVAKEAPFIKKHIPRLDIILPIVSVAIIAISWIVSISQIANVFNGFQPMYNWGGGYNPFNFTFFAYLGMIPLGLLFSALMIFVYYHLFKLYAPKDAVLFTIISAIGFAFIFIFVIRNKKPVVEESEVNTTDETVPQKTLTPKS